MPCSAPAREPAAQSGWELTETTWTVGSERPWRTGPKRNFCVTPFPSRLEDLCERGGGEGVRARGDDDPKETVSSRHNGTEARKNSQTVAACTGPAQVPESQHWVGEVNTGSHL